MSRIQKQQYQQKTMGWFEYKTTQTENKEMFRIQKQQCEQKTKRWSEYQKERKSVQTEKRIIPIQKQQYKQSQSSITLYICQSMKCRINNKISIDTIKYI